MLVIVSDNPPVNALGQAVRAGLAAGIEEALADDGVEAVVVRCDGRTFFAGADITEFGKPPQGPSLPEALDKLEASLSPTCLRPYSRCQNEIRKHPPRHRS